MKHMLLMPLQESICCCYDSMSCNGLANKVTGYELHSQDLVLSRSTEVLLSHQTHCPWGPPWVVADHGAKIKCAQGCITMVSICFHCLPHWQLLHFILMSQDLLFHLEELVVYTENVWYCLFTVGGEEVSASWTADQVKCDVEMQCHMVYRNTVMNSLYFSS
jgi:hypothetical protein